MPGKSLHKPLRKKSTSWKEVQTRRKRSKMVKLGIAAIAVVFLLLGLSWTVRFTQSLFSPWKLPSYQGKSYLWNGEFTVNFVIISDSVAVVSFDPKEQKTTIINIPDQTFIEVPHGFGYWQLGSIYQLGKDQKETGGGRLLKESLASFLGLPIDGYLDFNSLGLRQFPSVIIASIRENPISGLHFLPSLKTDLTAWELLRLKFGLLGVRFDKVKEVNLEPFLDKDKLPDGTEILRGDPVKVDSALVETADTGIVTEHKSIAVFNATEKPLLAQKAARLITNLGGNVIITNNAGIRLAKTTLTGEKSAVYKRLKQIFAADDKISTSEAISSRAEVNLFIGEDYAY